MKKFIARFILIAGCAVFWFPLTAYSAGPINPSYTYQVAVSSITTAVVTVSTTVGTKMDNPQLSNRAVIEIDNIDSTANLWCLPVSSSTPVALSTTSGRKILPGSSWILNLFDTLYTVSYSSITNTTTNVAVTANLWCISDGGASTKAAVTQAY